MIAYVTTINKITLDPELHRDRFTELQRYTDVNLASPALSGSVSIRLVLERDPGTLEHCIEHADGVRA